MKSLFIVLLIIPCFVFSQEKTLEEENLETRQWIAEKINAYYSEINGGCYVFGNYSTYYATDEYIEGSIWDRNGYSIEGELVAEYSYSFNEIIDFKYLGNCFYLYRYSDYNNPMLITNPNSDPEPNLSFRMTQALSDLVEQNKSLYPQKKEKY